MTKLPFCCDISNADVIFDNLCLSFRQLVVLTLSYTLPINSYFLFKTHAVNYTQNIKDFLRILGFFSWFSDFSLDLRNFFRVFVLFIVIFGFFFRILLGIWDFLGFLWGWFFLPVNPSGVPRGTWSASYIFRRSIVTAFFAKVSVRMWYLWFSNLFLNLKVIKITTQHKLMRFFML